MLLNAVANDVISVKFFNNAFYQYRIVFTLPQDTSQQIQMQAEWFEAFAAKANNYKDFQELSTIYSDKRNFNIFTYSYRVPDKARDEIYQYITEHPEEIKKIIENFRKVCRFDYEYSTKIFLFHSTIIKFIFPMYRFMFKYLNLPDVNVINFKEICSLSFPMDLIFLETKDDGKKVVCLQCYKDDVKPIVIVQDTNTLYEFKDGIKYVSAKIRSYDKIAKEFYGVFFDTAHFGSIYKRKEPKRKHQNQETSEE
jgi:hypothetical protein